jgi:DNA-binding response OmpR family regulator
MTRRLRVLVVSRDKRVAIGTRELLRAAGYDVCVRTTLYGGTRGLYRSRPDLVIADVRLGAFNGLHLAMRASWSGVPAVVLGYDDRVLQREAQAIGTPFVAGPIEDTALLALVESLASMALLRVGRRAWDLDVPQPDAPAARQTIQTTQTIH